MAVLIRTLQWIYPSVASVAEIRRCTWTKCLTLINTCNSPCEAKMQSLHSESLFSWHQSQKKLESMKIVWSEYCNAALHVTQTLQSNHLKIPQYYSSKQENKLHLPFDQLSWFICVACVVYPGSCLEHHLYWIIKNILLIHPSRQHFISSPCMWSVCSPWRPLHKL